MNKRRQLKIRSNPLVIRFSRYIAQHDITPNQISLLSIAFGALGMLALIFWNASSFRWLQILLLIIAIIGIQGRLLCNLFDGMVALEGGKKTPDGELYNEVPDRLTDIMLFVGLGLGLSLAGSTIMGLSAAIFAILTAYIRLLGLSMGTPAFFSGPLAKQHRMALLTAAIIATIIGLFFNATDKILYITLILINIGTFLTCVNRIHKIRQYMFSQDHESAPDSPAKEPSHNKEMPTPIVDNKDMNSELKND